MIEFEKGITYLKPCPYAIVSINLVDAAVDEFDVTRTYSKNQIIKQHEKTFISRTDNNKGNLPFITPLVWQRAGTTNTEAWRDDRFFTQSYAQDEIVMVFDAQQAESIALANVIADEIVIEQIKADGTIVHTQNKKMTTSHQWDWIAYWFYEPKQLNSTYFDIAIAEADYIRVRIKANGRIAMMGNLELGTVGHIGCETWGTTVNYTRVTTPQGTKKTLKQISFTANISRELHAQKAEELSILMDRFTFYFSNDKRDEMVNMKMEEFDTVDGNSAVTTLNITLKGRTNE